MDALAEALDLHLDSTPVCLACLSFVSFPLGDGDERTAKREARRIARDLWAEGLAGPLRTALEDARRRGVEGASEALQEVESAGARAAIVATVIYRLAQEQARRAEAAAARDQSVMSVFGFEPWPPRRTDGGGG
jgi:hypothetical protein